MLDGLSLEILTTWVTTVLLSTLVKSVNSVGFGLQVLFPLYQRPLGLAKLEYLVRLRTEVTFGNFFEDTHTHG